METSGGGGYGDPLERDLALVAADLAEGYVSPARAFDDYGVVVVGNRIDEPATTARRAALRRARLRVRLARGIGLDTERGRAIRLEGETAARLGVGEGAIVELVSPHGAPLRAWVVEVVTGVAGRAEVPPIALSMLALEDGAEIEVRAVHSGRLGVSARGDRPGAGPR
jgi:hypothetical protein